MRIANDDLIILQLALIIAFASCVIYGRTKEGFSFVKGQIILIFTVEMCELYLNVIEMLTNDYESAGTFALIAN